MRGPKRPLGVVTSWVRRQPPKVKAFLAVVTGMAALVFIRFIVHDHDNLFVAAEAAHALGIGVLIYKLTKEKTCAGSFPSASLTPVPDLSRSPVPAPIGSRMFIGFGPPIQRFRRRFYWHGLQFLFCEELAVYCYVYIYLGGGRLENYSIYFVSINTPYVFCPFFR